ncbi:MAG: hypothetical protein RIR97_676 [Pseudomonadota bacterium]
MICRHCQSRNLAPFLDLGTAPPSNAYLAEDKLDAPELWYPLRIHVCADCLLVQTQDFASRETLFSETYAYFSSFSTSWLTHAKTYVDEMVRRFGLGRESLVIEVAANDGYLLTHVQERGIPCLGIEPTASTANAARQKGIEIVQDFFGEALGRDIAEKTGGADLMVANNVLAHVPDINDFVRGFTALLKPSGVVTFEFPHLQNMIAEAQFDTAYHEHYSYLSLTAVHRILKHHGLTVFDVETTPWHGGSLRVFACRTDAGSHAVLPSVSRILAQEKAAGLLDLATYAAFQTRAITARNAFLSFLLDCQARDEKVAAYGAAAKGNTLLNYAGIKPDLIAFVIDKNPAKQGMYMPGSRIPIVPEDRLRSEKPERIILLPWNLQTEITQQLSYIRDWGGTFVTAIPRLTILP